MKKSIHKENLEKLHYNNFADHKTLRDTYLPSKLCRREVNIGATGTQEYRLKKGPNRGKVLHASK